MNKEKGIKETDAGNETDRFGNYTTDITSIPNIDSILKDTDKIEGILESIEFKETNLGELAIFFFNETKLKTSSEILIAKFKEALEHKIDLPIKATIVRKDSGKFTYYDIY